MVSRKEVRGNASQHLVTCTAKSRSEQENRREKRFNHKKGGKAYLKKKNQPIGLTIAGLGGASKKRKGYKKRA